MMIDVRVVQSFVAALFIAKSDNSSFLYLIIALDGNCMSNNAIYGAV